MTRQYKAKSGKTQYMPSLQQLQEMDDDNQGFCLTCGNLQDGCEPDAEKYVCDSCGEPKVYGCAELALRSLCY